LAPELSCPYALAPLRASNKAQNVGLQPQWALNPQAALTTSVKLASLVNPAFSLALLREIDVPETRVSAVVEEVGSNGQRTG
jgi:hypothetical protein